MKLPSNSVKYQVYDQVFYRVVNQVKIQIRIQVNDKVRKEVFDHVNNPILNIIVDQVHAVHAEFLTKPYYLGASSETTR